MVHQLLDKAGSHTETAIDTGSDRLDDKRQVGRGASCLSKTVTKHYVSDLG